MDQYRLFLFCTFTFFSASTSATSFNELFTDPVDGQFDTSAYLAENAYGFLPVPMIITEPAVGEGLGLVGLFFHEDEAAQEQRRKAALQSENAAAYLFPPNVSALAVAATSNGTKIVGGGHMGFFRKGDIRYLGFAGYGEINLAYYGLEDVAFLDSIELESQGSLVSQSLKFKLGKSKFFAGFLQRYSSSTLQPKRLDDLINLIPPEIGDNVSDAIRELLTIDSTNSGLGVTVEYDSRNNIFSPSQGYNYKLDFVSYSSNYGGDYDYEQLTLEALNYWKINDSFASGFRIKGEHIETDQLLAPFMYPFIDLRGIPAMRYQGSSVALVETQVDWKFTPRWTLSGFVGAGKAGSDSESIADAKNRIAYGSGFRYLIARRYGFKMGIDIARGPDETAWYIQAGSAW